MHVRYLGGELHGGGHHVHALLAVTQGQEDVAQQHEAARGQPVQILRVGHLQRLPQVALALAVLRGEEGLEAVDVVGRGLHAVAGARQLVGADPVQQRHEVLDQLETGISVT